MGKDISKREIGQRLRHCRKEAGLTQSVLSEAVGLEEKSYANIEVGQRLFSVEVLFRLSQELDVSADYILFGYDSGKTPFGKLLEGMRPGDIERIRQLVAIYKEALNDPSQ